MHLPIFPLHSVLFPQGCMPLRIFEARYLDMVKDCVRNHGTFAVSLIRNGRETGTAAGFYPLGTECEIVDWETTPEGLLGITVIGRHRGRISNARVGSNQLIMAKFERLEEMPDEPLPEQYTEWAELLEKIIDKLGRPFSNLEARYDSADWVGARLIEYLPIELASKQQLLSIDHPLVRLEHLNDSLKDIEYYQKTGRFST